MTFILDSINWDGMKYVLHKKTSWLSPLLHFSSQLSRSACSFACSARSARLPRPPLPSSPARGPCPVPCSTDLAQCLPLEARCAAPSAALLASQLARLLVGALRASPPLVCLTRFAGHHSGSSEALGLGVLAHRRCRCPPILALRPPPLSLPSHLSSPCLFNSTNREKQNKLKKTPIDVCIFNYLIILLIN